jgi:hypothetical protein
VLRLDVLFEILFQSPWVLLKNTLFLQTRNFENTPNPTMIYLPMSDKMLASKQASKQASK